MIDESEDLIKSYESFINEIQTRDNQQNSLDLSSIHKIINHYICPKCLKFPYIKFCKDRKHIRITCSCFNNIKILIKDYFNYLSNENSYKSFLNTNNDENIERELLCKLHKTKFTGFSKRFFGNYCQSCIYQYYKDNIIFDDIILEDKKK